MTIIADLFAALLLLACSDSSTTGGGGASSGSTTTVTISGSLSTPCLGSKTWTITTATPIVWSGSADCPAAGELLFTSSGEGTIKLKVGSNSSIEVYFNDTLVNTYSNCEDVDGLCSG